MLITSKARKISGEITVAGDKSISHRSIMLASISKGKSVITGFLEGEDCLRTLDSLQKLGVEINRSDSQLIIHGKGLHGLKEANDILNAGNSGTTMRLMSGILAGQGFLSIITGDASLRSRPMGRITNPLREMGAIIDGRGDGNLAPLTIRGGNLKGIDYIMPVASAQVKSAILLAGLYAEGVTTVTEDIQTRDHTERMLKAFGGNLVKDGEKIIIKPSELLGQEVNIPGDISSAAFYIVAAAAFVGSQLRIKKVGLNPTRTGIIDVLLNMGAKIEIENIHVSGGEEIGDIMITGGRLKGINITREIIPRLIDEIPVIAVAAALAEGKTTITGAEELKFKESNRISAMVTEMLKLGIDIKELPDGMEINGGNSILGGHVESYNDHRIAMALAICGLFANQAVKINNSQCISVSFPDFYKKLKEVIA